MLIELILGQIKNMEDSGRLILENLIKLTRSSENRFKRGNFKGALEDKIKANEILIYISLPNWEKRKVLRYSIYFLKKDLLLAN